MNRNSRLFACFLALAAISTGAPADTGSVQPLEVVQHFAESFVTERLATPGNEAVRILATAVNLDSRLRREQCSGALQAVPPAAASMSAHVTVGVRCPNPAWTVYVRLNIETELKVLVMRAAAARNSSLTAQDVELQLRRVPGIATDYLTSTEQLRNRHLKVAVSPGTALTTDLLAADILIRRGQRVTLVASTGGIEIRVQGEAIADATTNGRVKVMNLSSRKIVEGQVESPDRVRVSL